MAVPAWLPAAGAPRADALLPGLQPALPPDQVKGAGAPEGLRHGKNGGSLTALPASFLKVVSLGNTTC